MQGKITKVSGALVVAEGMKDSKLYDVCLVGADELVGEIIELRDDRASIVCLIGIFACFPPPV